MSEQNSGSNDSGQDFKKEVDALVEGAAGLFSNLREIFEKSRDEITRASRLGKTRLDLLQLDKDREHFLQRLGELTLGLMKDGTVAHESLDELAGKIEAIDARRAEYEAEVAAVAEEQAAANAEKAAASESANEAADAEIEATVEAANADVEAPAAEKPAAKKAAAKKPAAKKAAAKKPAAKKKAATKKKPAPKKDL
ncbi:MAG: hypothetical protein KDA24_24185 [Deltaproteobacteria bacterium]|nr:hypothetical protein [Deltaproteobacteria bacterium]